MIAGAPPRLARRDAIALLALFTAAALLSERVWHERDPFPDLHDEFVYVFQAKLVLQGRLAAPAPPLPEFFEAAHLLVTPRFTSKYLPGHAVALAPFVAVGAPWLWPCVALLGACWALFFALRWSGLPTAAAAGGGLLFLSSVPALRVWMTLLSHSTAGLCVAIALAAAARLRITKSPSAAAALAGAAAYAVWTRPFVGVALVLSGGALVLIARNGRALIAFAGVLALGAAVVLASSRAMTGNLFETPWAQYARQYMPFDGPGIGPIAPRRPERDLPPHLARLADVFYASRARHTLAHLPAAAWIRLQHLANHAPSALLLPLAGLAPFAGAAALLPGLFVALFFFLQLSFHSNQPFYLVEAWPALSLLIALGAHRLWVLAVDGRLWWPRASIPLGAPAISDHAAPAPARPARIAVGAALAVVAVFAVVGSARAMASMHGLSAGGGRLYGIVEGLLEPVRDARGLVFLRYPADWDISLDFTYNEPDLDRAPAIRALDLGARNDELRRRYPNRPAFLLDLGTGTLTKLPALGAP